MDKLQIYIVIMAAINLLVIGASLAKGDRAVLTFTGYERAVSIVLSYLIALPYLGRIFGWW